MCRWGHRTLLYWLTPTAEVCGAHVQSAALLYQASTVSATLTLNHDLDLDNLKTNLHTKNEVSRSKLSKVSRQTHRRTWLEILSPPIRGSVHSTNWEEPFSRLLQQFTKTSILCYIIQTVIAGLRRQKLMKVWTVQIYTHENAAPSSMDIQYN